MILSQPEKRIGYQEIAYFTATIVEDIGSPFLMLPFSCVSILIEVSTVKVAKSMPIFGKVCRHPVEEDADALLVHIIHEVLKVFRRTETTRGCVVAGHLVAPGTIERILGNRQQFDMGKTHIFDICCESDCQFAIRHKAIFLNRSFSMSLEHMLP